MKKHIYQGPEFGENWFSYPNLYNEMVQQFPSGSKFVEVGSWKGKSSAYMAVEIANSGKGIDFYCVDTWEGSIEHKMNDNYKLDELYDTFINNMKPLEGHYIPLRMTSLEAVTKFEDNSLDFVFIDASHEYEDVKKDIEAWLPKVKTNGILAGHDYYLGDNDWGDGVKRAVNELLDNIETQEDCFIYYKGGGSPKKTNIIDCFPYFNEKELLELRLNLLNDYVDYFIIIEGNRTHSGEVKEFTCVKDLENIDINTDKVIVLQVELPEGEDIHNEIDVKNIIRNELVKNVEDNKKYLGHWARERIQRDVILNFIDDYSDDTVFFITDCDEIVDPKNINYIASVVRNNPEVLIKIPLVFLEGSANYRVHHSDGNYVNWDTSTFACLKSHLKRFTPTELRCNISDYSSMYITENGIKLEDLGWHFSWMGDNQRRMLKCKSFLHSNVFNNENTLNFLEDYTPEEGNTDPLNRQDHILRKYPLELLPQKIFELPRVKEFLISYQTEEFDWGNNPEEIPGIIGPEIFVNGIYEKFVVVEEGDVVVDIGANVGAFGYSIRHKNVKMLYCVEPSNGLVGTLAKNLNGMPITIINSAISNDNDDDKQLIGPHNIYGNIGDRFKTITFKKFIEDYNIQEIDFLKIDCEGAEYQVFTEENRDYILNNVKNVAGEWHFLDESTVEVFKKFRDLYLIGYEYKVFDRNDNDVSEKILDDQYLIDYERNHRYSLDGQFMIYISYDASKSFTFSNVSDKRIFIVEDFYDNPDEVRDFALQQEYVEGGFGRGFIGRRSMYQFLFPGLKERFEGIIGKQINEWETQGMNGRFQNCYSGEPLVYHCDDQKWAGLIYLTPDAPPQCGTTLFRHKETKIRHNNQEGIMNCFSQKTFLDKTPYEPVDVIGNVYNRLVIYNGGFIHAASEYFGSDMNDGRLWHMFFFN